MWLPIDTAPKDGNEILVVVSHRNQSHTGWAKSYVALTRWESDPIVKMDKPNWLDMSGACSTYECFRPYFGDTRITHWMPLPGLPEL